MAHWQDSQNMSDNRKQHSGAGTVIMAATVGAAVGAAAGILMAPRSGQETRARMKSKAQETLEKGKNKAGMMKDKAMEAKETAKQAVEGGKQAVREARARSTDDTNSPRP
jgi:gas vesicle protein